MLHKVTRLPYIFFLLRGTVHRHLQRLHERYGNVVRVQPNEVSFLQPAAWRDIYGNKSWEREPLFFGPEVVGKGGLIRGAGKENHARVRKFFSPAFSDRAVRDQEPIFQKHADRLVAIIRHMVERGEAVPLSLLYLFSAVDIMADMTLGEPLGHLANYEKNLAQASKFHITGKATQRIRGWYPLLDKALNALFPDTARKRMRQQFFLSRFDKRVAQGETDRLDMWTLLLKSKAPLIDYDKMVSTTASFLAAGTETNAVALSGLSYLLLANPRARAKLVHELRSAFASAGEITLSNVSKLKYLGACVSEAMRVYPPFPPGTPRIVPSPGTIICGNHIPAGVSGPESRDGFSFFPLAFFFLFVFCAGRPLI